MLVDVCDDDKIISCDRCKKIYPKGLKSLMSKIRIWDYYGNPCGSYNLCAECYTELFIDSWYKNYNFKEV